MLLLNNKRKVEKNIVDRLNSIMDKRWIGCDSDIGGFKIIKFIDIDNRS